VRVEASDLCTSAKPHVAYIVQGHRFDIFEQVGCYPHIVNMLPAYFLVVMWPLVIGIISAIYCGTPTLPSLERRSFPNSMIGLTLWSFLQRQAQFSQFMSSNSSLTMSRYFRLMALAGVELLCTTPLSVFQMVLNATAQPLDPWVSWDDTHSNFSRVRLVPAVMWTMNRWFVVGVQFNRWSGPFCAFIFFAFFGFASEARKNYRNGISKVFVVCGLKRNSSSPQKTLPGLVVLPHSRFSLLTLLFSLRKLTLGSSSTESSILPTYTPPPPRYQPKSIPTTPTSPDNKGFVPLASAGTVSEFTISAYEKPLEPEPPTPRTLVGSLSSRASSTSVVDYVV